jgi:sugar phosphate isomerase/epimerase
MKIAVSNIAWDPSENDRIVEIMAAYGVKGIEIAPTTIWPDISNADDARIQSTRSWWTDRGISIVAMQSLLFGRPDLNLFGDADVRQCLLDYLSAIIRIAARLGASVLVFGSPKNRQVGSMDRVFAMDIAVDFFSRLGTMAHATGLCIGFEPNPEIYGCDFICSSVEALQLVRRVNNPGFRVHLDTAIMSMSGENFEEAVSECFEYLAHVHISEPMLGLIGGGGVDHMRMANTLRSLNYQRWVSVEMRRSGSDNTKSVISALDVVRHAYAM